MKVLITDNAHPILEQKLQEAGLEVEIDTLCTYESLLSRMGEYDGIVVRSKIEIDRHFIDNMGDRCKVIGRVGAGMETIDVDYAESKGIRCVNSPEGNRDAVGEHATSLLLSLFNKITVANSEVRHGLWKREANRGIEVKGKTIGIIGFGNMGAAFAQRLQGFECNIIAYDRYLPDHTRANFERMKDFVRQVSLDELQAQADVLSLHVPLTESTHYMVCKKFIDGFAKPFYLINTARGKCVKTSDLAQAMKEGKILGAALDVNEYEQMTKDSYDISNLPDDFRYLLDSPNTILTPHVGGWTVESKYKLASFLADKIITVLSAQ